MLCACGSIAMIEPLLNEQEKRRPSWMSWTAHVRLLTFVLRHSFSLADVETLQVLVNDFDAKFHAAYKGKFRRPKHHLLRHLVKYVKLYGPPRGFWCMSGEALLQRLKQLFEVCNYKCAPHSVLTMWNQRRALRFRNGGMVDEASLEWSSPVYASMDIAIAAASSQVRAASRLHLHVAHMQRACYIRFTCTRQPSARSHAPGSYSTVS